jgi:hypothetical protein
MKKPAPKLKLKSRIRAGEEEKTHNLHHPRR